MFIPLSRVIPILAVLLESVMRTLTVDPREPARTTSVLIPALSPVALAQSARWRTMLPSVDVPVEQLETHSETVEDSPVMRFVLHAELTPIVRSVL